MTDVIGERFLSEQEKRHGAPKTERVEAGRVRDFLAAIEAGPFDPALPVPPLFLLTLGRTRRPHLDRLPGGTVNANDAFEFYEDVFVGDEITIETRMVSVEKKAGSKGDLYLITAEKLYRRTPKGELVAKRTNSVLRWE
ncbi:FAS1-like dehydratase domain-containing protein [Rhizobium sp. C4]|uniref:FAS1-like dehydratase domain-containing protein n=1 Tax=Rhizobium sp. C4 TaxID=1349800 RepID=UPI001E54C10A|nr:MaoC family dehydratase N-terminal domain-containing protein [Rhizobium sp. C4]MCD2172232.1 MaoC family dehydratase N-terminal domain-containing protein [Rhizobium sp. C4]